MDKSNLQNLPPHFIHYVDLVENIPLKKAFGRSLKQLSTIHIEALEAKGKETYAPGKWTIHDILQHMTDCERIFAYRAMRIARKDTTPLAGFDQDQYAANAGANARAIPDLLDEYKEMHQSSARLFSTFNEETLAREGRYSEVSVSVLAIGYFILGHQIHHFNIIKDKYGVVLF